MNLIRIGNKIINMSLVMSADLREDGDVVLNFAFWYEANREVYQEWFSGDDAKSLRYYLQNNVENHTLYTKTNQTGE